jgi:hypothetical protein
LIRSQTIEAEVNQYRQLLEGSEQKVGLRQLIHMPHGTSEISLAHRPRTPSPSVQSSQFVSTGFVRSSCTHQNSTSETSYVTAPFSLSTANTTQTYSTVNLPQSSLIPTEYDTDNDQSQNVQFISGHPSRLMSETDATTVVTMAIDQEPVLILPNNDSLDQNDTVIEISIDTSIADGWCLGVIFLILKHVDFRSSQSNITICADEYRSSYWLR